MDSRTVSTQMKEAPSLLQLIPDIFFDALAYLLPASLLFLGVMTIPSSIGSPLVNAYLNLGASFDRFVVILFGIGMLYIIGQLLTHFSYDVILRPLRKVAAWRKEKEFASSDIEWMADYTFIRHKDAALGLEISKRYARTIMSRNNALVCFLLMILSLISSQWIGLMVSGVLFLLFSSRGLWGTEVLLALSQGNDKRITKHGSSGTGIARKFHLPPGKVMSNVTQVGDK